ncbi:hypothetical protein ES703_68488 [subsurface metagenome]
MADRYEYYNQGDDTFASVNAEVWMGQTFTPATAHKITSVKLKLYRYGSPGQLTVGIRATDGSGHPTGEDLCSGTIDGNGLTTNAAGVWYEITLGAGYNLDADTKYAIVARALDGSSANCVRWRYDDGDATFEGGNGEYSNTFGESWGAYPTSDFMFENWGEPLVTAPTVTTQAVSDIGTTTATGNGNITDNGGENCTRRGFCYMVGTSGDPTTADSVAYDDGSFGTGAYTKGLTGLSPGTNYRVRAYAVNSAGIGYGTTVQILTKPAAPTNVAATDGVHTDKVVITWTKSTGATGYQVYRDGAPLGWLGDVATYDDTGADAPTITPGTADASDGLYQAHVALSLSGQSANNGTTHTYKVRAKNATGESVDSETNTGYRGVGALTYQWQRSAADSDADYSNIPGATTASYNDTGAPADGSGRYYRCVENATGAAQQISAVDRGYRIPIPVPVADGDLIGIAIIRKS